MAKRFTETEKWRDTWFYSLPPKYKLLWFYLCDTCDHAGFWETNFGLASACIGDSYDAEESLKWMGSRIQVVSSTKWKICNFISYQYNCTTDDLNPDSKVHSGVIRLLEKHGILSERVDQGLRNPFVTLKDKDKDKEKEIPFPSSPIPSPKSIRLPTEGERRNKKNKNLWLEGEVLQGRGIGGPSMVHRRGIRGAPPAPPPAPSRSGGQIALSPAPISPSSIMQLWNALCGDVLPKTQIVNEKREQELKKRIKSLPFQSEWVELFEKVSASSFLNGATGKFKATFDWVIDPANLTKILEGNYDDDKKRR